MSAGGSAVPRAAELADQTLDAVASVHTRLERAVEAAKKLDGLLWETEKVFRERPALPREEPAQGAEPTRRMVLGTAGYYGSRVSKLMRDSQDQVAEVNDALAAATASIAQAKGFLDEYDELQAAEAEPAGRSATDDAGQQAMPANLRDRLSQLETAIEIAQAGAGRTAARMSTALRNAGRMQKAYGEYDTRQVPAVYEASEALNRELPGLQAGVGTTRAAHKQAAQAAAVAEDLATAVRAASNPTPRSAQQQASSATEQDRRDRSGAQPKGPQLNR